MRLKFSTKGVILIILFKILTVDTAIAADSCAKFIENSLKSSVKLQSLRLIRGPNDHSGYSGFLSNGKITAVSSNNREVTGWINYAIWNGPSELTRLKTLMIQEIYVTPKFRRQGISARLLEEALEANPGTMRIGADLRGTNRKIYYDAMMDEPDITKGVLDAIRATPAYKIRILFGFTVIESANSDRPFELDYFFMRKP